MVIVIYERRSESEGNGVYKCREVQSAEEALQGAQDIIAEIVSR